MFVYVCVCVHMHVHACVCRLFQAMNLFSMKSIFFLILGLELRYFMKGLSFLLPLLCSAEFPEWDFELCMWRKLSLKLLMCGAVCCTLQKAFSDLAQQHCNVLSVSEEQVTSTKLLDWDRSTFGSLLYDEIYNCETIITKKIVNILIKFTYILECCFW